MSFARLGYAGAGLVVGSLLAGWSQSAGAREPYWTALGLAPSTAALPIPAVPMSSPPATAAAGRVLDLIERVRFGLRTTRYRHATRVRERQGLYEWDCSGMASFILRRAAPAAMRAVGSGRPVARDFFRAIARAPTRTVRHGWERIPRLADARPGDVFAWLRPPSFPRRNTGHVGFLLQPPRPVESWPGAFALHIADATSIPHQNDTRDWEGEGGFGLGTIVVFTDAAGAGTHYGWHGTRSGPTAETAVVIGRLHR